jgi:uncharacterized membrane protein YheB (UPF0754 family)
VNGSSPWIQLAVHVVVGTLSGGLTNTVAVWMLFNPKSRRFGFQGAIPKNQARLARNIGRTVGERLLTPLDLQRELARPELREEFERHLTDLIQSVLASQEPLIDKVPPQVVTALEGAMADYLPLAMQKLGGFLGRPATREKMRHALHAMFERFIQDLRFHERVIAKLVVTESKLDLVLTTLEREGVEQLVEMLDDATIREEITRTIHDTVLAYLQKPITEVLSGVTDVQDPGSAERISRAATPVIWSWIHDKMPDLVQRLDLQAVVERKVMAFNTDRVEEIIRGVIQNELNLIIVAGFVLGAVVGAFTFVAARVIGL